MKNWPGTKTPTNFIEKIKTGKKPHSFREGDRWRPGMKIHMATGVRTPNYEQFNKDWKHAQTVVSTQKVEILTTHEIPGILFYDEKPGEETKARFIYGKGLEIIAKKDGFDTVEDFLKFFHHHWFGQIVHWTDLRY